MNTEKHIGIIGAGPAGLEAASRLGYLGFKVLLFEKNSVPGGHLKDWDHLFPTLKPASEVLDFLSQNTSPNVKLYIGVEISEAVKNEKGFQLIDKQKNIYHVDAILLATGFDLFDANKKEEYGYGIYDNVITSAELEGIFKSGKLPVRNDGNTPKRIGFVHCVGSRDEKAGNIHCSKVCCITAVKQAIEIRQLLPGCEAYCFYMDLRMYGSGYEELYKQAQEEYNVQFIRGRLSEACENADSTIMLKVQDTMLGRQLKLNVDLLVLMVGMVPAFSGKALLSGLGLDVNRNGFIQSLDCHTLANLTRIDGVFVAGSCKAPASITDTLSDARAAVVSISEYLNS